MARNRSIKMNIKELINSVSDPATRKKTFDELDAKLIEAMNSVGEIANNPKLLDANVARVNFDLVELPDAQKIAVLLAALASVPQDEVHDMLLQYSLETSTVACTERNAHGLVPVERAIEGPLLRMLKTAREIDIENFSARV
jgi:hypothetical protein